MRCTEEVVISWDYTGKGGVKVKRKVRKTLSLVTKKKKKSWEYLGGAMR